ncbi:MAG: DUF4105 domain-containing protein [Planctomycetaceae bacterium]|nr:DUF4105 domain-containing protein [Planctomycetaceae bacterium]
MDLQRPIIAALLDSDQRCCWAMTCRRKARSAIWCLISAWLILLASGCQAWKINGFQDRLQPSNQRQWSPEFAQLPTGEIVGREVTLRNIRNFEWLSEEDFVVRYYDRRFSLDQVQSVDFVVVPFKFEPIAHTMLSFGLNDGTYVGVSVEIRNEQGEAYSTVLGMTRQFEVVYVVADERDLIRRRTRHLNADVYVYPSAATPEKAQALLVDVVARLNQLAEKPEFYNTLVNNCTTNLVAHVNRLNPSRIPYSIGVLLPGLADRYAYELGILDRSVPFEQLRAAAKVNDLAAIHYDDPDFSQRIRQRTRAAQAQARQGRLATIR